MTTYNEVQTETPRILSDSIPLPTPVIDPSKPFAFKVIRPYSSDPSAHRVPFVIEGLFRQGGLSSLVAKPKQGKSSFSRYAAVCVSKGLPFLGRGTVQGEVLIISIEDPVWHINSCLRALGYEQTPDTTDAQIHLVDTVESNFEQNIAGLRAALRDFPGIRFVVIDTLAKFVRIGKNNDYDNWLPVFEKFRQLLTDHPLVSIVCLVHAKKVTEDDPFDAMLGSSALRGEFDTNTAIYNEGGSSNRMFTSETRCGRAIQPTLVVADLIEVDGTDVVRSFSLGGSQSHLSAEKDTANNRKREDILQQRVIDTLRLCKDNAAKYGDICAAVQGRAELIVVAVESLISTGVIDTSGIKGSQSDPYTLKLNIDKLGTHDLINRFGVSIQ